MDVAIEPEAGLEFFEKLIETFKTLVGVVIEIAIALDRGVGDHDVDTAGFEDLPAKFPYPSFHLNLGILILVLRIAEGAAQA